MRTLLWDASALAKRYAPEIGSPVVDSIFEAMPLRRMVVPLVGYAETFSLLVCRWNAGSIADGTFRAAIARLQAEVFRPVGLQTLSLTDGDVPASLAHVERYALNSTDAALLTAFLGFQFRNPQEDCLLIASDKRLLRAAGREELQSLNPEAVEATAVPRLLRR